MPDVATTPTTWASCRCGASSCPARSPVVAGSDELPIPNTHLEVAALHEVGGLTPQQVSAAATDVAREALDLPADPDDVATYARDPRGDLSVLRAPVGVG